MEGEGIAWDPGKHKINLPLINNVVYGDGVRWVVTMLDMRVALTKRLNTVFGLNCALFSIKVT